MKAVIYTVRGAAGIPPTLTHGFVCPGCKISHGFNANTGHQFNGDLERPTLTPSLVIRTGHYRKDAGKPYCHQCAAPGSQACTVCHSIITDGRITFLDDCTHDLAGQTVELAGIQ